MSQRAAKQTSISRISVVLANTIQAEKGQMACIDTASGEATIGATSLTLIPVGYFDEDLLGDGSLEVKIRLFQEVWVHWFDNDTGGTPVVAADLMQDCYILDGATVTGNAVGASVAGRVWALDTVDGVAVEMVGMNAG